MISASSLTLRRGARALLEDTSFTLHAGWRTGVVGRNGTGKSTLFAALLGEIHPDRGGSAWLAGKVQQASDTLLQATRDLEQAGGDRASDAPRRAGRPSR